MVEFTPFSVLMSVYQKEKPSNLTECLDSILINQTVIPNEIVLIKDGPLTEGLNATIASYQAKFTNLKVYSLKENVGLGEALRYGITKCSNELVARMDTDDIACNNRFEKQLEYLQVHPEIDVLGSHISEFTNTIDNIVSQKRMPLTQKDILSMLKRRNPMCHVTVMFKKSSVLDAGNYYSLPYVEDYYLWARMIQKGFKFVNLNKVLVYVRVGDGMYARRGNREQIQSWKVLNEFMYKHKMISKIDELLNMLMIRVFVYMPVTLKEFIYKKILRK